MCVSECVCVRVGWRFSVMNNERRRGLPSGCMNPSWRLVPTQLLGLRDRARRPHGVRTEARTWGQHLRVAAPPLSRACPGAWAALHPPGVCRLSPQC